MCLEYLGENDGIKKGNDFFYILKIINYKNIKIVSKNKNVKELFRKKGRFFTPEFPENFPAHILFPRIS